MSTDKRKYRLAEEPGVRMAEVRLGRLGLDPDVFLHNEALYSAVSEVEHVRWIRTASDEAIKSWAKPFLDLATVSEGQGEIR